jgi:serine protease Do
MIEGIDRFFRTSGAEEQFKISDPFGLRQTIQPIVSIPNDGSGIYGLGACFQVSPWGWLTAQHVLVDKQGNRFPEDETRLVGFSPGAIFGGVTLRVRDYFGMIVQVCDFGPEHSDSLLSDPKSPDILIDCAALRVKVDDLKVKRLVSPLPLSTTSPSIGDKVLAIGFPILGVNFCGKSARHLFEEQMVGAAGVVTKLYPQGRSLTRPWPTFEIEGNWKSGMSGGPVINKEGAVVGVVSSSFPPMKEGPGIGYAVDIALVDLSPIAPEIDRSNPGWCYAAGLFRNGKLLGAYPNEEAANIAKAEEDLVRKIRINPKTEEWSNC